VLLRERLRNFETALAQRGLNVSVYNNRAYAHEYVIYALDTVGAYFQSIEADTPAPLEPRGAHIFAVYVAETFMEIIFMAQELDA